MCWDFVDVFFETLLLLFDRWTLTDNTDRSCCRWCQTTKPNVTIGFFCFDEIRLHSTTPFCKKKAFARKKCRPRWADFWCVGVPCRVQWTVAWRGVFWEGSHSCSARTNHALQNIQSIPILHRLRPQNNSKLFQHLCGRMLICWSNKFFLFRDDKQNNNFSFKRLPNFDSHPILLRDGAGLRPD